LLQQQLGTDQPMPRRPAKPAPRHAAERPGLGAEIGKRRPFEAPEVEAFLNVLRTASLLTAETGRFLKKHGLTEPQYNALRILRGHMVCEGAGPGAGGGGEGGDARERGVPSQTIGEQLVAQVPDVTRLVDRLVEAGLAERARVEADRRVVLVCITRKGLDLLARIDAPLLDLHRRQLGHMTRAELRDLSRLLVKARRPDGDVAGRCP
jgi:DNA-binding MarR family transcriptional regulator